MGFDILEARDVALDTGKQIEEGDPWFRPLTPSWHPLKWPRFQFNPVTAAPVSFSHVPSFDL